MSKIRRKELTGQMIDAMSIAEKAQLIADIEAKTPEQLWAESTPLTAPARSRWNRFKKKIGRPKIGKGAKVIAVSVEAGLLKRADAYAKRHGLKRAQLIALGLNRVIREDQPRDAA